MDVNILAALRHRTIDAKATAAVALAYYLHQLCPRTAHRLVFQPPVSAVRIDYDELRRVGLLQALSDRLGNDA